MATNEGTPEVHNGIYTHSLNDNKANILNTIGKKYIIIENGVINKRATSVINVTKVHKLRGNTNIIDKV